MGETYLRTNKSTDSLLSRADSLVPRTGRAIGVVLGDAVGRGCQAGELGCRMRGIVLGLGLLLLGLALSL